MLSCNPELRRLRAMVGDAVRDLSDANSAELGEEIQRSPDALRVTSALPRQIDRSRPRTLTGRGHTA